MLISTKAMAAALALLLTGFRARAQDQPTDPRPEEHAPVFADLSPADAGRRAAKEDKLLIIKGTAVWCGPCKHMDRTTFRDPRVVEWISEHAIAIQLDVDTMPGGAKALRIDAMPTIIVFRGKTELDRVVGYRDADELLAFLRGAAGEHKGAHERGDAAPESARARFGRAQQLERTGSFDEATDECEWLWVHVDRRDPDAIHSTRLPHLMKQLAAEHPPARARFAAIREDLGSRVQPGDKFDAIALDDWLILNEVLDDEQRTREWIDLAASRENAQQYFTGQTRLFRSLVERDHWALAGDAMPPGRAEKVLMAFTFVDEEYSRRPEVIRRTARILADHYAAILAAGRTDEAARLASGFFERFDSDEAREIFAARARDAGIPEGQRRVWESGHEAR